MEAKVIGHTDVLGTKVPGHVMIAHGCRYDIRRGDWYTSDKKALKWADVVGVRVRFVPVKGR